VCSYYEHCGIRGYLIVLCGNVTVDQWFSNTGPRPGTGPWHQLYRAV